MRHKTSAGLRQADKLPEPIFTPSTKATEGMIRTFPLRNFCNVIGTELAQKLKEISIKLYEKASRYAESKGIILADTKFEFGILDGSW